MISVRSALAGGRGCQGGIGFMEISSDRTSDKYLELNICGIQKTAGRECAAFRPNGRLDYHILYLTDGCCVVTRNGAESKIAGGNMILFRPHEPQFYKFPAGENVISHYLHFTGVGCDKLLEQCGLDSPVTYIGKSESLERIFSRLISEYILKRPLASEVCAGILQQFLACAGRRALLGECNVYPEGRIEKICRQMHRDISDNYPISYYAAVCNMSESRFSHAFKEQTGVSPKQYLIKIKIDSACSLLENQGFTIAQAAQAVGIDDLNYFSRLIRLHTGHTPGWFRRL